MSDNTIITDDQTSKIPREFVAGSSPARRLSPRRQVEAKRPASRVCGVGRGLQNKTSLHDSEQHYSQEKAAVQRRNSPDKTDRNRDIHNSSVDRWAAQRGQSRERAVRRVESRNNRQDRKAEIADKEERRGRDRGKKYGRYRERDIHYEPSRGGQKGHNQSRRPPRAMADPQSREKRSTSLEVYRHRDIRRSSSRDHQSRNNENYRFRSSDRHSNLRRDNRYRNLHLVDRESSEDRHNDHEHLGASRDSLEQESCTESWTSTEGNNRHSVHIAQEKLGGSRLISRRYSPSPRRRSTDRRYSSPTRGPDHHRRRSPERRHPSHSPQRRMQTPETRRSECSSRLGLMVTSEQLMSQKQRLRPVRPAALSDLSNIPEHSLNDISLILKTAMTKRRDAFDEELSGRDTFRSEDLEWSDWH